MLMHLGLDDDADRLREAVDATTRSGVLPPDLGGTATTDQVVAAVISHLSGPRPQPRLSAGLHACRRRHP